MKLLNSSEMCDTETDVLWMKHKSQNVTANVNYNECKKAMGTQVSGDGALMLTYCRLCAGDRGLQNFSNSQTRWDKILYHCFGIMVTALNCMICENCRNQLKSVERFKSLVEAAFEKTSSDSSCHTFVPNKVEMLTIKAPARIESRSKEICRLRHKTRGFSTRTATVAKKTNVACNVCKQRYTMIVPESGWQDSFVCSRCKNCNVATQKKRKPPPVIPVNTATRNNGDFKKLRLCPGKTFKPLEENCENVIKYHREPRKYQCSQFEEKFLHPQRLAVHVSGVHKANLKATCIVCGSDLKTREKLEKHLKLHTGELQQCGLCMQVLKNKRALQAHMIGHNKEKVSNVS